MVLLHIEASLTSYQSDPSWGCRKMQCRSKLTSSILAFGMLLCAVGLSQRQAHQGGTLTGSGLDQTRKAIPGATAQVKGESGGVSPTVTTDSEWKLSAPDLAEGNYSIVVSAPGFALTTRSGGQITAGATLDSPITISGESVATAITVKRHHFLGGAKCSLGQHARGGFHKETEDQRQAHQEVHVASGGLPRDSFSAN